MSGRGAIPGDNIISAPRQQGPVLRTPGSELSTRVLVGGWLLALTFISFFYFPGHTILQSDTQIYLPILERLWDPSLFSHDIMASRPHVSFTLFDEIAIAIRRITGSGFEEILMVEQFVFRAAGILGIYLLCTGLGLSAGAAMLVTSIACLGATITGPAVITFEYEPVPRGFALPLVLLGIGLVAHQRWNAAALAAGLAFVLHPPTALAFWALLLGVLIWKREYKATWPLFASALLMTAFVILQPATMDHIGIFSRVSPELEKLQRMRASYNWVSVWIPAWAAHYTLLSVVWAAALVRIRRSVDPSTLVLLTGLPLIGILSLPGSWIMLEHFKWALIPQFQPGRYLLYVTLFAVVLSAVAGVLAAQQRSYVEAFAFFLIPFAVPMEWNLFKLFLVNPNNTALVHRLIMATVFALVAVIIAQFVERRRLGMALSLFALLPFFLIPQFGKLRNYPSVHQPELNELASWARTSTPKDALFQFADAGQSLTPGIFRARSLRALYVDWKAGGQVNFLREFPFVWWDRWQRVEKPQSLTVYRDLGIDYVVYSAMHPQSGAQPVFRNSKYLVYEVRKPTTAADPLPSAMAPKPVHPGESLRSPRPRWRTAEPTSAAFLHSAQPRVPR
jgi:hypothetical protein